MAPSLTSPYIILTELHARLIPITIMVSHWPSTWNWTVDADRLAPWFVFSIFLYFDTFCLSILSADLSLASICCSFILLFSTCHSRWSLWASLHPFEQLIQTNDWRERREAVLFSDEVSKLSAQDLRVERRADERRSSHSVFDPLLPPFLWMSRSLENFTSFMITQTKSLLIRLQFPFVKRTSLDHFEIEQPCDWHSIDKE